MELLWRLIDDQLMLLSVRKAVGGFLLTRRCSSDLLLVVAIVSRTYFSDGIFCGRKNFATVNEILVGIFWQYHFRADNVELIVDDPMFCSLEYTYRARNSAEVVFFHWCSINREAFGAMVDKCHRF